MSLPRRPDDSDVESSMAERRSSTSTVASEDLSAGSISSSTHSYRSDNLLSPNRSPKKLGKRYPTMPSPRPSLALSNDGSAPIANIEDLKERLSNTYKKNKERRRTSLASHFSGTQSSSLGDIRSPIRLRNTISMESFTDDNQSLNAGDIFLPPLHVEIEGQKSDLHTSMLHEGNSKSRDYNTSATTILFGNNRMSDRGKKRKNQIKKEQIIESIVWFSFHIPRTVLEDLIAHELQIWSRNLPAVVADTKRTNSRNLRKNYKKLNHTEPSEGDIHSDVSISSLSDCDGDRPDRSTSNSFNFKRGNMRRSVSGASAIDYDTIRLPKAYERKAAILFVDMSGFTKLSRLLDVESLSKIINSYFDLIVSEVILYGGDILKFAGDAFFAEWRVAEDLELRSEREKESNPLSDLNASLASIIDIKFDENDLFPLTRCVLMAAKCASSIVKKFSDYHVTSGDGHANSEAMLNVHCGVGVGPVVGLHVRDCKDGEDEDTEEMRREFLLLGSPIDQVRSRFACQMLLLLDYYHIALAFYDRLSYRFRRQPT
jgi:class 3 adenylate cyclase